MLDKFEDAKIQDSGEGKLGVGYARSFMKSSMDRMRKIKSRIYKKKERKKLDMRFENEIPVGYVD